MEDIIGAIESLQISTTPAQQDVWPSLSYFLCPLWKAGNTMISIVSSLFKWCYEVKRSSHDLPRVFFG
jgi:hypothetical protein